MSDNRWVSQRTKNMPVNAFATMDAAKCEAAARGHEVIDLSLGSSDLAAPAVATNELSKAVLEPDTYGYCLFSGTKALRHAAVDWYERRYHGQLDPHDNIQILIGSQEGFGHLLLAVTDPGDLILITDPAYPNYFGAVALAGLEMHTMPLLEENAFLPDLAAVPEDIARRARVMVLSYPNNPTASVAPADFFEYAVDFCRRNQILLIHDFPYVDMVYDGYEAPSALAVPGAMDTVIELYSFSKSYHMGGLRIGWAAGNEHAIHALRLVKNVIDFSPYVGIQRAAIAALNLPREEVKQAAHIFEERRNILVEVLNATGWEARLPHGSMFVWSRLPGGLNDSFDFAVDLVKETGVAVAPGRGFGPRGEGYIRFALVREPEVLRDAALRIRDYLETRL
jgi:aspartate/methionine/tyrosine aminotransferase